MDAWRISHARHAADGRTAFSGTGSRMTGGRWNSKHVTTLAYASATLSLAVLELLVHSEERFLTAASFVSCKGSWPDDLAVETAPEAVYVPGWRNPRPPRALPEYGDQWVAEARTAILLVRSAVIPSERNVLVNPAHPDAARIVYAAPEPFTFDWRLIA